MNKPRRPILVAAESPQPATAGGDVAVEVLGAAAVRATWSAFVVDGEADSAGVHYFVGVSSVNGTHSGDGVAFTAPGAA